MTLLKKIELKANDFTNSIASLNIKERIYYGLFLSSVILGSIILIEFILHNSSLFDNLNNFSKSIFSLTTFSFQLISWVAITWLFFINSNFSYEKKLIN
ncbi:hypothetical protein HOK00_09485 [bacterium]|jgi:hypothetical protein|nr:hypothetical protein [bacterium]